MSRREKVYRIAFGAYTTLLAIGIGLAGAPMPMVWVLSIAGGFLSGAVAKAVAAAEVN